MTVHVTSQQIASIILMDIDLYTDFPFHDLDDSDFNIL